MTAVEMTELAWEAYKATTGDKATKDAAYAVYHDALMVSAGHSDPFAFDGGFDPSPKTNVALREVFAPAVAPSRRERDFASWTAEKN